MSLPTLNDIIDIASAGGSVSVSDILRKSLVLANSLGVKDFESWIRRELNGYTSTDELPNYRISYGILKAINPRLGLIPFYVKSDLNEVLSKIKLVGAISGYEKLIKDSETTGDSNLMFPFENPYDLMLKLGCDLEITRTLSITNICVLLDSVKTIILDWGLKLKDNGIAENKSSFSPSEKKEARSVVNNIIIENFQGVLGNISDSKLNLDADISDK